MPAANWNLEAQEIIFLVAGAEQLSMQAGTRIQAPNLAKMGPTF